MKSEWFENTKKFLDSEEGQKSIEEFFAKENRYALMLSSQLERFKTKFGNRLAEFIEKVEQKYNSNKYRDSWYKRGIEPPEDLYFFLFDYAVKYGREASGKEWEKYANTFTSELYHIDGFFFNKMNGQGTVVKIEKGEPIPELKVSELKDFLQEIIDDETYIKNDYYKNRAKRFLELLD